MRAVAAGAWRGTKGAGAWAYRHSEFGRAFPHGLFPERAERRRRRKRFEPRSGGGGSGGGSSSGGGGGSKGGKSATGEQKREVNRVLRAREGEHYEVLQLTADATTREAKSAFRRLARLLHPDKSSVPRTADAFFRLQAAHEVLADADRKAEYDRMRDLGAFSGGGGFGGFGGGAQSRGGYRAQQPPPQRGGGWGGGGGFDPFASAWRQQARRQSRW